MNPQQRHAFNNPIRYPDRPLEGAFFHQHFPWAVGLSVDMDSETLEKYGRPVWHASTACHEQKDNGVVGPRLLKECTAQVIRHLTVIGVEAFDGVGQQDVEVQAGERVLHLYCLTTDDEARDLLEGRTR